MLHAVKKFIFGDIVDVKLHIRVMDRAIELIDERRSRGQGVMTCNRIIDACDDIGVSSGTIQNVLHGYHDFHHVNVDGMWTAPYWWNCDAQHFFEERRAALCAFRDKLIQDRDALRKIKQESI